MGRILRRKNKHALGVSAKRLALSEAPETGPNSYVIWRDVIGVVDLGVRDPARTTADQFLSTLRERSRELPSGSR